ncbi:MAG: hypothetical protein DMG78_23595 [Acidobacteria bacterium]|nr:MAG: hypothetical protein DMG78_23595 [Acidobacteriota bacterium]
MSQTVTRNREDSEDAVQEALLKAFQNLAEFRKEVSLDEDFEPDCCYPQPCLAARRASIDEL